MPDWLRQAFGEGPEIPIDVVLSRLVVAFGLGSAVALVYASSHKKDETYQAGFLTTLVLLSVLIAAVTQVIGDNVARAFSLVGALSIVRFRTVVADTRDTAFVIFAVVVGMSAGGGQFPVALGALVVGGCAAFLVRPRGTRAAPMWRLTVRVGIGQDHGPIESLLQKVCAARDLRGTATTRQGAALDLSYDVRLAPSVSPSAIVAELNGIAGVQQSELTRI